MILEGRAYIIIVGVKFSNIEKLLGSFFFTLLGLKNKGTGAFDQLAVIF